MADTRDSRWRPDGEVAGISYPRPSLRARALNLALRRLVKPVNRRLMQMSPSGGLRVTSKLLGLAAPTDRPDRVLLRRLGGVPCDVVRPRHGPLERTLLYLHGGGFVLHAPPFYRHCGRRLAHRLQAEVIIPDYRLAPRHPFPAPVDDCLAVYCALLEEGHDPSNVAVLGDSAGGNLLLSMLLQLRDRGMPLPACAVPISPATDLLFAGDSMRTNAHLDPLVAAEALPGLGHAYAHPHDLEHHYVSPVNGDFTGLPPMSILVGSTEVLLDDSLRVADAARAAGVSIELHVWPEMPHVFPLFHFLPEARTALELIARFVLRHTPDKLPGTTPARRQS
jgi:acetyl esterase/lipase